MEGAAVAIIIGVVFWWAVFGGEDAAKDPEPKTGTRSPARAEPAADVEARIAALERALSAARRERGRHE